MAKEEMKERPQIKALKNKLEDMPRMFLTSKMTPEIKKWSTGVDYKLEVIATQVASRELEDGTIQAEFELKSTETNGRS